MTIECEFRLLWGYFLIEIALWPASTILGPEPVMVFFRGFWGPVKDQHKSLIAEPIQIYILDSSTFHFTPVFTKSGHLPTQLAIDTSRIHTRTLNALLHLVGFSFLT